MLAGLGCDGLAQVCELFLHPCELLGNSLSQISGIRRRSTWHCCWGRGERFGGGGWMTCANLHWLRGAAISPDPGQAAVCGYGSVIGSGDSGRVGGSSVTSCTFRIYPIHECLNNLAGQFCVGHVLLCVCFTHFHAKIGHVLTHRLEGSQAICIDVQNATIILPL